MKKIKIRFDDIFPNILAVCALLAVGIGLYLAYLFIIKFNGFEESVWSDHNLLGMAGEFIGGTVGSIWALAGVILFFLALIYQKRELKLQRIELHESRKIMDSQSKTLAIQQFENTFFQLLNFHMNAANLIRTTTGKGTRKITNAYDELFLSFKKETNALRKRRKSDAGASMPSDESFELCFTSVYEGYKNTFQHYLENYKTLLLFIHTKSHDPAFYFNILKSHFTEQEVLIHFYFILFATKNPELLKVTEKYHLFQKLNQRAVEEVDGYHLQKLSPTAYEKDF